MGGTLTLYTAAMHADLIKGAITINGTVQIGSANRAALTLDPAAPEMVPGIGSDISAPGVTELAYSEVPVAAFRQSYALVGVTRDLLPRITCPTLVIQSRQDHVVDPRNGPRIVRLVGANRVELLWLDNSYHVATLDNDQDLIASRGVAFIQSIAGR
jgi:carboxylesterase